MFIIRDVLLKRVLPTTAGKRTGEFPIHVSFKVVQYLRAWAPC